MHDDKAKTILKRDVIGRVTLRREKREALLDEFERSGLKGTQFARMTGINYGTFASWVQDRRHARGEYAARQKKAAALPAPAALRLVEAVVAQAPPPGASGTSPARPVAPLEVVLPGGVRVFVASTQQAALAVQLIQALRASC